MLASSLVFVWTWVLTLHAVTFAAPLSRRAESIFTYPVFRAPAAAQYRVNTSALPLVEGLPVQDSWAGRLALSNDLATEYFFWYFPSSKQGGSNRLTLWLNGGPGCSSLNGPTQETGPFLIKAGSDKAVLNDYSWTRESDMLYVDQPATVGFSTGSIDDMTSEIVLAEKFYRFLQTFYKIFPELKAKELHLAGESYAAQYISYIATRLLNASPAEKSALPLTPRSMIVNDGTWTDLTVSMQALVPQFAAKNKEHLGFSDAFIAQLNETAEACGFNAMLRQVTYPQHGPIQLPDTSGVDANCDLWTTYYIATYQRNPCFNMYDVTKKCPAPLDLIDNGDWLNRADVQAALHVSGDWQLCTPQYPFVNGIDDAPLSETLLPSLLAKMPILMWHGMLDGIMLPGNELVMIQNTTWNGAQGFSTSELEPVTLDGAPKGRFHHERGLTYLEVDDASHQLTKDQPALAFEVFSSWVRTGSVGSGAFSTTPTTVAPPPAGSQTPVGGHGSLWPGFISHVRQWLDDHWKEAYEYLAGLLGH